MGRFKDHVELEHGHHFRMAFDDDQLVYSLTILDAYKEDSGEYKCIAVNPCGSATTSCNLKIMGQLFFSAVSLQFLSSTINYCRVERRKTKNS